MTIWELMWGCCVGEGVCVAWLIVAEANGHAVDMTPFWLFFGLAILGSLAIGLLKRD